MVRSVPPKFDVMAMVSVERPISMVSSAGFCNCGTVLPLPLESTCASALPVIRRKINAEESVRPRMSDIRNRNGEQVVRPHEKPEGEAQADRQHQKRQQKTQLFAAQFLPGTCAILRADDTTNHQKEGKHNIDGLVGRCLQDGRDRSDEGDL